MVYLPYYENSMLGNNEVAGMLPFVSDDAGTPFAVGIIAMDDKMAIKARPQAIGQAVPGTRSANPTL